MQPSASRPTLSSVSIPRVGEHRRPPTQRNPKSAGQRLNPPIDARPDSRDQVQQQAAEYHQVIGLTTLGKASGPARHLPKSTIRPGSLSEVQNIRAPTEHHRPTRTHHSGCLRRSAARTVTAEFPQLALIQPLTGTMRADPSRCAAARRLAGPPAWPARPHLDGSVLRGGDVTNPALRRVGREAPAVRGLRDAQPAHAPPCITDGHRPRARPAGAQSSCGRAIDHSLLREAGPTRIPSDRRTVCRSAAVSE